MKTRQTASFALVMLLAAPSRLLWTDPAPTRSTDARVLRGAFERRFLASGELRAKNTTVVRVPLTNTRRIRISRIVDHGSYVEEGQIVAAFDTSGIEQNVRDQELRLLELDNEMEIKRWTFSLEKMEIVEQIETKKLELEKIRLWLPVDEALQTPQEVQRRRYEEKLLLLGMKQAEMKLARKREEEAFAREEHEIRRKRILDTLERAAVHIERMTIKAPRSGYALCSTNWQESRPYQAGDEVWGGRDLIEIPDMGELEGVLEISEVDAFALSKGMRADVTLDIHPDKILDGTITKISNVVHEKGGSSSQLKAFEVIVTLGESEASTMRPGMSIKASILMSRLDNVLLVPRACVDLVDGVEAVRLSDGGNEVRPLEIIDRNEIWVAVRSGVEEGVGVLAAAASGHGSR